MGARRVDDVTGTVNEDKKKKNVGETFWTDRNASEDREGMEGTGVAERGWNLLKIIYWRECDNYVVKEIVYLFRPLKLFI